MTQNETGRIVAMNISVILCTWNRCEILPTALESIAASRLPPAVEWEVVVVDNSSSDQTRAVVEEFCRRYPGRFRYVFEPQPGKAYALNTGIRTARGEILAFTDDDVTVEPDWLKNLTAALVEGPWAGAGGRTLPAQTVLLPRWLALDGPFSMGGTLCAHFNLGDERGELDRSPYGANMAFQKKAFEKHGEFRTDLGTSPNPDVPRPNEDTEFGRRLMAAGERLWYEPSAVVYHPIPASRVKKDYLLSWYFDWGRAGIREIGHRPDLWGIPRPYLTMLKAILVIAPSRMLRWVLAWNPQERFYCKARVWAAAGEIAEIYHRWFSKRASPEIDSQPIKQSPKPEIPLPGSQKQ